MKFSRYIDRSPRSSRFEPFGNLRFAYASLLLPSGDGGIRTLDPLLARQVLSQLSYTPINLASTCFPIPSPV